MLTPLLTLLVSQRLAAAIRRDLLLDMAALRQQLDVLCRSGAKPKRCRGESAFWICLRRDTIELALDRSHLTHRRVAEHLGLSRSYWSQVLNRHRHLTPMVRQCLLGSRYLKGIDEHLLWDIHQAPDRAEARP